MRSTARFIRLTPHRVVMAAGAAAALTALMAFGATFPALASHTGTQRQPCGITATVHWHGTTYHIQRYGMFGIVPEKGKHIVTNVPITAHCPAGAQAAAAKARLIYHGGPLELHPHVFLDFFGNQWSHDANGVVAYMTKLFKGLGVQPQDNWSTITSQYKNGSGSGPSFSGSVFGGAWMDNSKPSPGHATANQLAAEARAAAQHFGVSGADEDVFVLSPHGTHPAGFNTPGGNFCAFHDFNGTTAWTNMPYVLDLGASCGANSVQNKLDGFSIAGGHEYAEAVTDPHPPSGYVTSGGSEIGDLCAFQNLFALHLPTGAFAMQPLWSNRANGCVQHAKPGAHGGR
ncbi:MAG TPA: hypothetical protein VGS19_18775 [Streptosporangiaceae bacterium]|nr:hypothetical protein [Streptosporangiaceae bacterium]